MSGILGKFSVALCVLPKCFDIFSAIDAAQSDGKITASEVVSIVALGVNDIAPCFTSHPLHIKVGDGAGAVITDAAGLTQALVAHIEEAARDGVITVDEVAGILGLLFATLVPKLGVSV